MENGLNGEGEENGEKEEQPDKQVVPEKPAKKIRVTYEEYRTIANLLILHLRQVEETSEEGWCYIVLHCVTLCYIGFISIVTCQLVCVRPDIPSHTGTSTLQCISMNCSFYTYTSPSPPSLTPPSPPHTHTEEGGMRRGELVDWYLKEVEADIETIEELAEKKVLVEKVMDRLVQHVSVCNT